MNLTAVVLAAGLGKRMNSTLPKVLHPVCGKPMLHYVFEAIRRLGPVKIIAVVGKHREEISKSLGSVDVSFVLQKEPKGTAHALMEAFRVSSLKGGPVIVLNGDMPLISPQTLRKLLALFRKNRDALSILSFNATDPSSYGRVLRDDRGSALRIVEDRDASAEQKRIAEVNSGIYILTPDCQQLLKKIRPSRSSGEYYLTDILEEAVMRGYKAGVYCIGAEAELMGVNTRPELMRAHEAIRNRTLLELARKGVSFMNPSSVSIHHGIRVGRDTVIHQNVSLEGLTRIGTGCTIYPNVRIADSIIGNGAVIKDCSVIEESFVHTGAQVGPFAHIRPGSTIGPSAKIGNFVEVKKSVVGEGSKAMHLSYIGDATVGRQVNVGAGTITCNYDGIRKYRTVIEDRVFVGSDTQLVAPVTVGRGAYIAAGSTITRDVPPGSLALSRTRQKTISGWASQKRGKPLTFGGKGKKKLT